MLCCRIRCSFLYLFDPLGINKSKDTCSFVRFNTMYVYKNAREREILCFLIVICF